MGKKDEKTNVMRLLEQKKIPYNSYNYLSTGAMARRLQRRWGRIRILYLRRWLQKEDQKNIMCL